MSVAKRRIERELAEIPHAIFEGNGCVRCPYCDRTFLRGEEITIRAIDDQRIVLVCACGDESLFAGPGFP